MKLKNLIAGGLAAILAAGGLVLVATPAAQATEVCTPSDAWTEVVTEGSPAVDAVYETVVIEEAGFQRYSWTGGPHESDTAPAFPSADWQANAKGDPHGIGVAGAYFQSNGNSGEGDWFYLEAVPAVTEQTLVTPAKPAVERVVIEHPAVTCDEDVTEWHTWAVPPPYVDLNPENSDDVNWPQTYVGPGKIAPTDCGLLYQQDKYTGTRDEIDAVLEDGSLTQGEDFHLTVEWKFVWGPECEEPVVVEPSVEANAYSGTCIDDNGGFTYAVTVGSENGPRNFQVKSLGDGTGGDAEVFYREDGTHGAPGEIITFTTVAAGESDVLSLDNLPAGDYRVASDGSQKIKAQYRFDFTIEEGAEYQSDNPEAPCYVEVPPTTTTNGKWTTPEITCENEVGDELPITRTVTTVTYTLDPKTGDVDSASSTSTENGVYVVTEADIEALDCPVVTPTPTPTPTETSVPASASQPPLAETGGIMNPWIPTTGALLLAFGALVALAAFLSRRRHTTE